MWWVIPFVTSLILSFAPYALADEQPRLMLDTGGHMAAINDIAFTQDGKQLVSASDDKTIRVWSLQTGKTVRVLRGEVEAGESGKIASMAISPDGKWLAAGVRSNPEKTDPDDNFAIRLYDFASGEIVTLLNGHKKPVVALAFSPNSKYLISGSEDSNAMLWDVAKQSLIEPPLVGHVAPIRAVAFATDNKQFVTGDDRGIVMSWKVEGNRYQNKFKARFGVTSLDVANGIIGVGHGNGDINLWELATTDKLKMETKNAAVRGVKFDGDVLWAWVEGIPSCGASDTPCPYRLETVNVDSEAPGDIKKLDNQSIHKTVSAASIEPQYELAAAASEDHKIRVWNLKTGAPRTRQDGEPLILGGVGQQPSVVAMLDDGRIGWGNNLTDVESGSAQQFPQFVLALPSQQNQRVSPIKLDNKDAKKLACPEGSAQEPDQPGMVRCGQKSYGNLSLQFRDGYEQAPIIDIMEGQNTREEGTVKTIKSNTDDTAFTTFGFAHEGRAIIAGETDGSLSKYDLHKSEPVGKFVGHTDEILAIATSKDDRLLVSGSADQTVKIWNLKTHKLLVTLFYATKREWVMWTPAGYFASGPGAEDLVGWHINRGAEKSADFFPIYQFRDEFYRPDIIQQTLATRSEEQAIREAPGAADREGKTAHIENNLPPVISILSPSDGDKVEREFELRYALRSPTGRPVDRVYAEIKGRKVGETISDQRIGKDQELKGSLKISLPGNDGAIPSKISLFLYAEAGSSISKAATSKAATVTLQHVGSLSVDDSDLPEKNLYALVIGVSRYKSISWLDSPDRDAVAFKEFLVSQKNVTYKDVTVHLLTTREDAGPSERSTKMNIDQELEWLGRQTSDVDSVALIYFSGHGKTYFQNSYLLAEDFDGKRYRTTAIDKNALLSGIRGPVFLFIDTCFAARGLEPIRLDSTDLVNSVARGRSAVYAFASSLSNQLSIGGVGDTLSHFTETVLEGLNGEARRRDQRDISTSDLDGWLDRRVPLRSPNQRAVMNKTYGSPHAIIVKIPQSPSGSDVSDFESRPTPSNSR